MIIPIQAEYDRALDEMASKLGGTIHSGADIPLSWQRNILIPLLIDKTFFLGMLDPEDFLEEKLKNIRGDSIVIDYAIDPNSKYICSNGIVYQYASFTIGDSLYLGEKKVEAEDLVDSIGAGKYTWRKGVTVTGNTTFQPVQKPVVKIASNDTLVDVSFGRNYKGKYAIEFLIKDVFPMEYRFVWRSSYRTSGKFAIYINDLKIKEYDTYNLSATTGVFSVAGGRFFPKDGLNMFDFWVNNITEFGDVRVKIEYISSGLSPENGLNIDYISLIPKKK